MHLWIYLIYVIIPGLVKKILWQDSSKTFLLLEISLSYIKKSSCTLECISAYSMHSHYAGLPDSPFCTWAILHSRKFVLKLKCMEIWKAKRDLRIKTADFFWTDVFFFWQFMTSADPFIKNSARVACWDHVDTTVMLLKDLLHRYWSLSIYV